jgi:uncharacterized protein
LIYKNNAMFGKLNNEEIDDLLARQFVGRIGCHADGVTYIVPVSYAFDGTSIYVHSYNGMKMEMLRKNPRVCFQVDDTRNLAYWQSVICWGQFEELKDEAGKDRALKILQSRILPVLSSETMHVAKDWPFPSKEDKKMEDIFFRIRLTDRSGRFEKIVGEEFYAT